MVRTKKAAKKTRAVTDTVVKLRHHHAKPYRKRHVGLLIVSVAGLVVLLLAGLEYRTQVISSALSSRNFVSDLFSGERSYDATVHSSYGFSLTYDQRNLYASAINGEGNLAIGSELATTDAYSLVRLAPNTTADTSSQTSMTINYHPEMTYTAPAATSLEAVALKDAGLDANKLTKVATKQVTLGGKDFTQTQWETKQDASLAGSISAGFSLYTATIDSHPLTIVIRQSLTQGSGSLYDAVLASLSFETSVSAAVLSPEVIARADSSRTLLDTVLMSDVAAAATSAVAVATSEKVAATYGPAVVKIFNVYCTDILVDGALYGKDFCNAGSGSGFFLSQDGYIGTNGHVVTMDTQDLVIRDALAKFSAGDGRYLNGLLGLTNITQAEIDAKKTDAEKYALFVDKIYALDASRFTTSKKVQNLLVDLSEEQPDIALLIKNTKDRVAYQPSAAIKAATLVGDDYLALDGYDGYRASDVALIKIDGENYPVTKVGSIDLVSQGANIAILGFPGAAGSNVIAESKTSKVTLTTGKVSAIKNASGSDKKLIETDTTIGHGNSGGPVLNDDGFVVGIATYTVDGSGDGNGVFNYIRNVQDLSDLVVAKDVTLETVSATQVAWEKGLDAFYLAHYSKALTSFETVKSLDPYHSRVQEFIDTATKRIANGEEVADFPVAVVVVVGVLLLAGATVAVVLIVRHNKKHVAYSAGVAQGTVTPAKRGDAAQHVTVSAPVVTAVVKPVVTPIEPVPSAPEPQTPAVSTPASAPVSYPQPTPVSTPAPVPPVTPPSTPTAPSPVPAPPSSTPTPSPAAPPAPTTPPTPENPWFTN